MLNSHTDVFTPRRMASLEIKFKHKIATIVCILCILLGIICPLCCGSFGKYFSLSSIFYLSFPLLFTSLSIHSLS